MFTGKKITVGITGGIAAYKAADIVSWLAQQHAMVQVVMTKAACQMISPLTLQALCGGRKVATDLFAMENWEYSHIGVVEHADLLLVAPATANMIGKFAHGIADDMLSSAFLAATCSVALAPAMNTHMFAHPAVQENLTLLKTRGCHVIEPEAGHLACGQIGKGRLADTAVIKEAVTRLLCPKRDLLGKKVLITAGPTQEPIDPVRFLSNRSSGKMGYALAEEATARGAEVTLVSGPVQIAAPQNVRLVPVQTADEMAAAVFAAFAETDIAIAAAAVADYKAQQIAPQKIKKENKAGFSLNLIANTDILAALGQKKEKQILIGFAAETENCLENAVKKLHDKNLDMIVANDITKPGAGFDVDTNIITMITKEGVKEALPQMSKRMAATAIFDAIREITATPGK